MQRNAEKHREIQIMQRNDENCREMPICRDILMTFKTHGNAILDILEPQHLENMAHVGSYRNLKNLVEF